MMKSCAAEEGEGGAGLHRNGVSGWLIGAGALLIAVAGGVVYCNAMNVPFLLDDMASIRDNESIRQLWPLSDVLSAPDEITVAGRPVASLSFAINYAVGGPAVRGYHLVNVAIHILAALVLFGIVRRTLQTEALTRRFGGDAGPLALVVAMIWMLHPLQTESVTYIVQRVESLMGLFYLLTLYCAIRAFNRSAWGWSAASVVACALGMSTKEVMATAPIVVLLYDRVFVSASLREVFRKRWKLYAGLFATWGLLGAILVSAPRAQSAGFNVQGLSAFDYAIMQGPTILHYLRLAVWPDALVFDYGWVMPEAAVGVVPGVAAVCVLLGISIVALVRWPRVGFLGVCFFLILGPSSSFVAIKTEIAAEHRMYLPLAAVMALAVTGGYLGLGVVVRDRKFRIAAGIALAAVVAGGLGTLTRKRNVDYASALSIWTDTVSKQPGNFRAQNNLANFLSEEGRFDEAIVHYREAVLLQPGEQPIHKSLAQLLTLRGRHAEAVVWLKRSLALKPDDAVAHCDMAYGLARLQRTEEAMQHYREAMRLAPEWDRPPNNLAWLMATHPNARYRNGVEAVRLATRACELTDHGAFGALDTLAAAYAETGNFVEAVRVARKALEVATRAKQDALAAIARERVALYRSGRPCREKPEDAEALQSETMQ